MATNNVDEQQYMSMSVGDNSYTPTMSITNPPPAASGGPNYTVERREVQSNDLAENRLAGILKSDSPLMQLSHTQGMKTGAQRGLLNSSISAGAAQNAMIQNAMPLALQDSQTYFMQGRANQDAGNRMTELKAGHDWSTGEREAGQAWQTGEREAGQGWQTGEREATQTWQTGERQDQNTWQGGQNDLTRDTQIATANISANATMSAAAASAAASMANTAANIAAQREQAELNRNHQTEMQVLQQAQQLETMGFNQTLNIEAAGINWASGVISNATNGINAISSDTNLTPEARETLIQNVINQTNESIAAGAVIFNTTYPSMTTPGQPQPAPPPSGPTQNWQDVPSGSVPTVWQNGQPIQ